LSFARCRGDPRLRHARPRRRAGGQPRRAFLIVRIGVISDTHGVLRPEALTALAGSERIVHAGDIGDTMILQRLADIAPVTAVRGNNDTAAWARAIPDATVLVV